MSAITIDAHVHVWNRIDGRISDQTPVSPRSNGLVQVGDETFLGIPAYMTDCAARARRKGVGSAKKRGRESFLSRSSFIPLLFLLFFLRRLNRRMTPQPWSEN